MAQVKQMLFASPLMSSSKDMMVRDRICNIPPEEMEARQTPHCAVACVLWNCPKPRGSL